MRGISIYVPESVAGRAGGLDLLGCLSGAPAAALIWRQVTEYVQQGLVALLASRHCR